MATMIGETTLLENVRPRVSVCLAAYNGERYIATQVNSILSQLAPGDQLIICDDDSSDGTVLAVSSINDCRIIVQSFSPNIGHVRNFERAIRIAAGDLIFLSDQDDIWLPYKLSEVVQCFSNNPDVQIVHHALLTMNADGISLTDVWNPLEEGRQARFSYLVRQLIKCQVFGCALAFRRSLIDVILPFPAATYAHDHWLAIIGGVFGPTYFINKPLVRYRQHETNLTPRGGLHWFGKISVRFRLLSLLFVAIFRRINTYLA